MRTTFGIMMIAASICGGIALLASTYLGYVDFGDWHNGELWIGFDFSWQSHWMWIVPIGLVFVIGCFCLIFSKQQSKEGTTFFRR